MASDLVVSRFAVVRSDSICDCRIRDENSKRYPVAKSLSFSVKECAGKTVSLNDARVSAEITGIVSGIKVNVGDAVKEGEPIALLDCQEHETNLNRMRAMLDAAQAELVFQVSFESGAALSSKKSMSQEQVSKRRSEYTVARAEVACVMADLKTRKEQLSVVKSKRHFQGLFWKGLPVPVTMRLQVPHIVRLLDNENIEFRQISRSRILPV